MDNTLAIVITGIYTTVYLIVFLIQRSELDKIKEVNKSMTSFMNMFDLEKLKEYNSIIEKTSDLKVESIKKEQGDKLVSLSKIIIDSSFDSMKKITIPKMDEMRIFILVEIMRMNTSMEDKKEFIIKHFPENSESFIVLLESLEKNKTV